MRNSTKLIILTAIAAVFCGLYLFQGLNGSFDYALPRRGIKVLAMAITGVAIAYSTVIFQTITHNRILTPSIMGLDSLYLLLQTVVIFFLGSSHVTIVNKHVNFILSVGTMVIFALYFTGFCSGEGNSRFTSYCSSESSSAHFSEVFRHFYKCSLIRTNLCLCRIRCLRALTMSAANSSGGRLQSLLSLLIIGWRSFNDLDVLITRKGHCH